DALGDDDPPSSSGVVRLTARGAIDTSYGDAGLAALSGPMGGLVRRCDGADVLAGGGRQLMGLGPPGEPWSSGAHPDAAFAGYDPATGQYVLVASTSTQPPSSPLVVSVSRLVP